MASTGACVPAMAKRCFWITATPEFATCLHHRNTREGHSGCLACLAFCHSGRCQPKSVDNIAAVFERRDRVNEISFYGVDHSLSEKVLGAMQEPFPGRKLTEGNFGG